MPATATRTFSGVIAPVCTPFGEDGAPDPERFIAHADWLMRSGCTALAPFGTTSEANSLGLDERMELLEELIDSGLEPETLMPGTGMCSVHDAIVLTQHASDLGVGGCLMLPPFYYKGPSEEGLFRYYAEVIEAVGEDDLKVYLYHIPPVAQVGVPVALVERLRKAFPGVIRGLKDSSGDWASIKGFIEAFPDLEIFPGSEAFLLDGLRLGGAGVISASANINPGALRKVFDHWKTADADALQAKIGGVRKTLQTAEMIPLLKGIIAHYRNDPGWAELRPPFVELPAAKMAEVVGILEREHGFRMDGLDV
jgi:4-hydroxy-tetrahydrodipicolinate synthase